MAPISFGYNRDIPDRHRHEAGGRQWPYQEKRSQLHRLE
jgi:hypothetical protein